MTQSIHFQVNSYLLSGTELKDARRFIRKRYALAAKRIEEQRNKEVLSEYAESFARSLDPHTTYMPQDVLDDFQINMQLSLEGIGASLTSEDGYTIIEELIPGGAADKLGVLKPKDKIIAVKQAGGAPVSAIDMDLKDVVKMIRGKKGTPSKYFAPRDGRTI